MKGNALSFASEEHTRKFAEKYGLMKIQRTNTIPGILLAFSIRVHCNAAWINGIRNTSNTTGPV